VAWREETGRAFRAVAHRIRATPMRPVPRRAGAARRATGAPRAVGLTGGGAGRTRRVGMLARMCGMTGWMAVGSGGEVGLACLGTRGRAT
jgi:hypothetical protein